MNKLIAGFLLFQSLVMAQVPERPTLLEHPGSAHYLFTARREIINISGRKVDIFLPNEAKNAAQKSPVIIFGHGQAIDVQGYEQTFIHLAQKGIVVIHPTYDTGFFDQDWRRMGADFNSLAANVVKKYSDYIDESAIVYSGHSKGAYIALLAAGHPNLELKIGALVLFAPAGFDSEYLKNIDSSIPVTLAWSDKDTVIKKDLTTEIYEKLPSKYKQWIQVKSYSSLPADHFYPLNKSYFFGGMDGVTAYHYFVAWKWLVGASLDLKSDKRLTNPYIYGDEANSTGINGLSHEIVRNW